MGIDMVNVNARVSELQSYVSMMKTVKKKMSQYSIELSNNWDGMESYYYLNAVSHVEKDIERIISELEAVGEVITSTASQLKLEEELAERARQEAEAEKRLEAEEKAGKEQEIDRAWLG